MKKKSKMKRTVYDPIKRVKAFAVVRGRNTLDSNSLYSWGSGKPEPWLTVYCIFTSRRRAMQYINHWVNKDDFTCAEITILMPEAN